MFSDVIPMGLESGVVNIDESKIKDDKLSCPNNLNFIKKDEKWFIHKGNLSMSKEERKQAQEDLDFSKEEIKTFMKEINKFSEKVVNKLKEKILHSRSLMIILCQKLKKAMNL